MIPAVAVLRETREVNNGSASVAVLSETCGTSHGGANTLAAKARSATPGFFRHQLEKLAAEFERMYEEHRSMTEEVSLLRTGFDGNSHSPSVGRSSKQTGLVKCFESRDDASPSEAGATLQATFPTSLVLKTVEGSSSARTSTSSLRLENLASVTRNLWPEPERKHCLDSRSPTFNLWMGAFVLLNTLNYTIQVETRTSKWKGSGPMVGTTEEATEWVERVFVAIFTFEAACRFYWEGGPRSILQPWNAFDYFLLLLGYADILFEFLSTVTENSESPNTLSMLSLLRMFRLLRLVKLTKYIPVLRAIVDAFMQAMKTGLYAFALLGILIWCAAIFLTESIGNSTTDYQNNAYLQEERFATIFRSMISLFQIMTLDSWCSGLAWPAIKEKPYLAIAFLAYVAATAFGMTNILVALVVDAMNTTMQDQASSVLCLAHNQARLAHELTDIFNAADISQKGTIDSEGFAAIFENQSFRQHFDMEIMKAGNLPPSTEDLMCMFDLTIPEGEEISRKAFIEILSRCCYFRPCDSVHVLLQTKRIERMCAKFDQSFAAFAANTPKSRHQLPGSASFYLDKQLHTTELHGAPLATWPMPSCEDEKRRCSL